VVAEPSGHARWFVGGSCRDPFEESVEVCGSEAPVEWAGCLVVSLLECGDLGGAIGGACKFVRGEQLALDDGEVDRSPPGSVMTRVRAQVDHVRVRERFA
jgi:hypothetical protein